MTQNNQTVTSKDGTRIAYEMTGTGPTLIHVDGAIQFSMMDEGRAELTSRLAEHFTVIRYDRRGRGMSTDTQPYAMDREIEDIEALIDLKGEPAFLYGISSGASLALEAALKLGSKVRALAMYEPPYNSDPAARQTWKEYTQKLGELLAQGRRGDAVGLFMMLVGAPPEGVDEIRQTPIWPVFESVAPTLAYDHIHIMGEDASVPTQRAAQVRVPTLVLSGGNSYPFMHETAVALAHAIPNAQHRVLEGQTHEVSADALVPVLVEFFHAQEKQRS